MTSVGALLCHAGTVLRAAGIEGSRHEARLLLSHALGLTREALLRDPGRAVAPGEASCFEGLVAARAGRTPLAHLTGQAGFWTLDLDCGPETLVPRPDSETLIEAALAALPERGAVRRVLDLGTGTGALLLAALSEFPDAFGVGVDRSPAAAALARRNAAANGLAGRAALVCGDWASALSDRFDLVLSNPPYVEAGAVEGLMPEVSRHEPRLALDGGADGLDAYRALAGQLPRLLAPEGRAVLELGMGQGEAVRALMAASGLRALGGRRDLGGVERALVLAREETLGEPRAAH